ncbi:MAG: hypothetical protein FJ134_15500 [Deltaproteobacteria bacterium]|nr:hypothetical protein [Deltaproteobacteria bacterium]
MNQEAKEKTGKGLKTVLSYTGIFILNTWRRMLILGRKLILCYHAQRRRRAFRQLGRQVFQSHMEGEVNPMLTEGVKDAVDKARAVNDAKDWQYRAISVLREKIRTAGAAKVAAREEEKPPEEAG